MADPQPDSPPGSARTHAEPVTPRALRRRDDPVEAPGRHHPLFHEPLVQGRRLRPAAPNGGPDDGRVHDRPRRGGRPAGRRRAEPGAGPGAPLPGPRPAARAGLLLDLLPLLHPLAGRRPRRDLPEPFPPRAGHRLHPLHSGGARRADLRRRPADPERRAPGLAAVAPARDPARRDHPHRHQGPGRAAPAHHPEPGAHAAPPPPGLDEPALHASRRSARRRRTAPASAWPTPASRSAPRPCC